MVAVIAPRTKLLPVSLVRTRSRSPRMVATIFVVVVLPLVPLTTTTPCVKPPSARDRYRGKSFSTMRPGSALPRRPMSRSDSRTASPTQTASMFMMATRLLSRAGQSFANRWHSSHVRLLELQPVPHRIEDVEAAYARDLAIGASARVAGDLESGLQPVEVLDEECRVSLAGRC